MKTIKAKAGSHIETLFSGSRSGSYPQTLRKLVPAQASVAIVCERRSLLAMQRLYTKTLTKAGYHVRSVEVPAGERIKLSSKRDGSIAFVPKRD